MVVRRYAILLEAPLLRYFAARMQRARLWYAQWLRHASLWPIVAALRKWGVPYTMLVQHTGDVLLLAPGCYYAVFDSGACVSQAMYWADSAGAVRAADHKPCKVLCRPRSLADHLLAPLQWQAAANQPLTVASVPWQLSATPTRLDRRYQPALGQLWRLGDGIGGVVQLVDGAQALVSTGPHSTDGVSSLSLSLSYPS